MVYELRTYTLYPGKMPEYLKAAETIGRPARGQNFGVNHGYWTAEFGALNQIWHLWKYDSLDARERLRGELPLDVVAKEPGEFFLPLGAPREGLEQRAREQALAQFVRRGCHIPAIA